MMRFLLIPLLLLSAFAATSPTNAFANLTCPSSLDINESDCDGEFPQGDQQATQKNMDCHKDCGKASSSCKKAKSACDSGKSKEAGDIAKGENASQGAEASSNGDQGTSGGAGGTQAPNANNMCSGQQTNQNRANDGAPIPPAMDKCKSDAGQCKLQSAKGVASKAGANSASNGAENAQRAGDAAQMGQKCDQSKQNESKMPQMPQIPQMPQQQQQSSTPTDSTINTDSSLNGNTSATNTSSALSPEISSVNFGTSPANGGISVLPVAAPSQVTGGQSSGGTNGSGQGLAGTSGSPFQSGAGSNGSGSGSGNGSGSYQSGGGSSGGLGSGSGASLAKSSDGIAGADIKPEGSGVGEYNIGGGKSVLGLKGKGGDEEDTPAKLAAGDGKDAAALAKALADAKAAADAKNKRGTSSSGADRNDDSSSLFTMVRNRYKTLKELGSI
jgi:hypothetical protein